MQTAKPWDAASIRPERIAAALGKLLAVTIILTPLAMMLFPELNHRSGTIASSGRQGPPVARPSGSESTLNPVVFRRSEK